MNFKPQWQWLADGHKTWEDIVEMADAIEDVYGALPLPVRAKKETSWLITLNQKERLQAIASLLERCYPDDQVLQEISKLIKNRPKATPAGPTAQRYSMSIDAMMEEEKITRTEALKKLATYLNEQPGGGKTKTAESLRVEISKWKNSNKD
mgnify:CR=1 FL=1